MEFRNISGFEFVKAGEFVKTDIPCNLKRWDSYIKINFFDKRYERADETVYVVTTGENILYVGEFSYNLRDRWLTRGYVNHHMYSNINDFLESNQELYIWLAVEPYCNIESHGKLNISKSLEQHILNDTRPNWNRRNKNSGSVEWRVKNCIKLNTFINIP
ncbi:hypothetical protein [Neptunomonas antarctica]|uniref:GIY-YIG domain-containing protein n=1 Tax=Neptunomonas antarctica TaxID=619304 RepID=A0A1N7MXV1_9GAMM|nr:hypothetical protein [Neptunomonas antarctica]SIS90947.1 hypothetical protein SAMN05421760_107104 [Neptunomonas antarctica]